MTTNSLALFESALDKAPVVYDRAAPNEFLAGLGTGVPINRLKTKSSAWRFEKGGTEVEIHEKRTIDVVLVRPQPAVGRIMYEGSYSAGGEGEGKKPLCFSEDGKYPSARARIKQNASCEGCKHNVKGSKVRDDGSLGVACQFRKKMVVAIAEKTQTCAQDDVFILDLSAQTLFGKGTPQGGLFGFREYFEYLAQRGIKPEHVVTRLSFDSDVSTVKVLFSPVRPLDAGGRAFADELRNRENVLRLVAPGATAEEGTNEPTKLETAPPAPAPAPAPAAQPPAPPAESAFVFGATAAAAAPAAGFGSASEVSVPAGVKTVTPSGNAEMEAASKALSTEGFWDDN